MKRLISVLTLAAAAVVFTGCTDALVEVQDEAPPTCTMPGVNAGGNLVADENRGAGSVAEEGSRSTVPCKRAAGHTWWHGRP